MNAAYDTSRPVEVSTVADHGAEPDAHRRQVEDRLEEAREHDDPARRARRDQPALHHRARVACPQRAHTAAPGDGIRCLRRRAHLASLVSKNRRPSDEADDGEHDQVAEVHGDQAGESVGAVGDPAPELGRVPQRRDPADPLQPERQRVQRVEGSREEEHRHEDESLHERELALVVLDGCRVRHQRHAERQARQQRDEDHAPRRHGNAGTAPKIRGRACRPTATTTMRAAAPNTTPVRDLRRHAIGDALKPKK